MVFLKESKRILFAVVLSPALLGGLAMASQPAALPQNAMPQNEVERGVVGARDSRRDEARLQRQIERLELELRVKQLELELHRVQLRLVRERIADRAAGLELSYPLDGYGWRVDANGIIRDRGWRPVVNWGGDDAIGLWGVDTDRKVAR